MTDTTLGRMVDYGSSLRFSELPASAIHETKRRLIDTLGCMLGAYDEAPSHIARGMASRSLAESGARVIGSNERGLFGLVGDFTLAPFGDAQHPYAVTRSSLKYFLSE